MPETSLTERALAAIGAAELPVEQIDLPQRTRARDRVLRLSLLGADAVAVVVAWFLVGLLPVQEYYVTGWVVPSIPFLWLFCKAAGLYDRDQFVLHKTTLDEAPSIVGVSAVYALLIEGVQAFIYTGGSHPLPMWILLTISLVMARALVRFAVVRTTSAERVLVIGDAEDTAQVRRKLANNPALNAQVVGRVGISNGHEERMDKLLGTLEELPAVIDRHRIERVIIAPSEEESADIVELIRLATACGVRVEVLPRMLEVIGTALVFDDLGGQVMLGVRSFGLSPSSRVLKRTFDVVVASVILIVLSPLLLAIAVGIKISSRGPVLFRQVRVGRHGREFKMLKFRTMVDDADARKHELVELNAAAPMFKVPDDPRTTSIGRHLRRRSLDELPQLFNVLRGDMSLVGPRPLITEEDRLFSGWERRRYHVAPGVTGPWQILGSSRVPMSDMVTIDYLYCANWSLWLDAKILVRTLPYVLSRRSPEYS